MNVSDKDVIERVHDAQLLWSAGRREGGLLCVLVAVAARGRMERPSRNVSDRNSFELYVAERLRWHISVEYRGNLEPIEHVFYKWLRCHLVHEGSLPVDIEFVEDDALMVRAGGAPGFKLLLSTGWFHALVDCALK